MYGGLTPKKCAFLAFAAICACVASPVSAAEQWSFSPLPYLPSGGMMTSPSGINSSGQIVGSSYGISDRAVILQGGTINDLSARSQSPFQSYGSNINDAGQAVGSGYLGGNVYGTTALLWSDSGVSDLGALPGGRNSSATDINSSGLIVGFSDTITAFNANRVTHAVAWGPSGIVDLGVLPGGSDSRANAINNAGQVVGYSTFGPYPSYSITHAALWQQGQLIDLSFGSSTSSLANDINFAGQIVGQDNEHAALWQQGTKVDLGTLDGDSHSVATSINSAAWIVGYSDRASNASGDERATLWRNGVATDLNSLDAVVASGWKLLSATQVNDAGQIIGMGVDPSGGFYQGFLLSPIPEPSIASFMFSGLVVVFGAMSRASRTRYRSHITFANSLPQ